MTIQTADESHIIPDAEFGDTPPPIAPLSGDLENNAVFQILARKRHRLTRQRLTLIAGYALAWVAAGSFYLNSVFGFGALEAFPTALTLTITHLIVMANLFFAAGIEGYETNGWLKAYFGDLIETGVPAEEIARGILETTTRGYSRGWIRMLLVIGCSVLLALRFQFRLYSPEADFFVTWTAILGIFAAANLAFAITRLQFLTLPGTLRWYTGIRRSYENRLLEIESPIAAGLLGSVRFLVFISVSIFVLAAPLAAYYAIGLFVQLQFLQPAPRDDLRIWLVGQMGFFAVLAGALVGYVWGIVAELSTPRLFAKLTEEVRQLFELRRRFIFERPR